MKSISTGLQAALADREVRFKTALCAEITRTDTVVFRFTSWDHDLTVDGDVYASAIGFDSTAVESNGDGNVDQMQVRVLLNSAAITKDDILKGIWHGAEVRLFVVKADEPELGPLEQRFGWLGNITLDRGMATCEFLGLMQHFQSTIGEVVSKTCLNVFCGPIDSKGKGCGLDIADFTEVGAVTDYDPDLVIGGAREIVVYSNDLIGFADGYFDNGLVTFDDESWMSIGIKIFRQDEGAFVLKLVPPFDITAGMTFEISRGCGKRHTEDCIGTYSNGPRFRGFPHLKGTDKLIQSGESNG